MYDRPSGLGTVCPYSTCMLNDSISTLKTHGLNLRKPPTSGGLTGVWPPKRWLSTDG